MAGQLCLHCFKTPIPTTSSKTYDDGNCFHMCCCAGLLVSRFCFGTNALGCRNPSRRCFRRRDLTTTTSQQTRTSRVDLLFSLYSIRYDGDAIPLLSVNLSEGSLSSLLTRHTFVHYCLVIFEFEFFALIVRDGLSAIQRFSMIEEDAHCD